MGNENGKWITYHNNGEKESEGEYFKGYKVNNWNEYHDNGKKRAEGFYQNDLKTGDWLFWFDNDKKQMNGNYKNGLRDGGWTFWDYDGHECVKRVYIDDKLQSDANKWNEKILQNLKAQQSAISWDKNGNISTYCPNTKTNKDGIEIKSTVRNKF